MDPVLDHALARKIGHADAPDGVHIVQRVAVHHNYVGKLPDLQGPQLGIELVQLRCDARRRSCRKRPKAMNFSALVVFIERDEDGRR